MEAVASKDDAEGLVEARKAEKREKQSESEWLLFLLRIVRIQRFAIELAPSHCVSFA